MSIRVQCDGCGSVMTVRDDYAGTKRRCPKCKGEFAVPTLDEASAAEASASSAAASDDDFDPVAFLTGEKGGAKSKSKGPGGQSGTKPPAAKPAFDPMDVLEGGGGPKKPAAASAKSTPAPVQPPAAKSGGNEPKADEFDPLAVLGQPAAPPPLPAASTPGASAPSAAPSGAPEKPQPRRPSWAKPLPEPEQKDWDPPPPVVEAPPPAAPEKPQPRRPSWAKAAPAPEKNDWDDPPAKATTTSPAESAAASPQSGESRATSTPKVAEDASPAAKAAADAMAASVSGVSADNPLLQQPAERRPLIRPADIAAWFRRRTPLLIKTAVASLVLYGVAWSIIQPRAVEWSVIGDRNELLQPVPVSGRITVDGKPVPNARIMFHPRGAQFRSPEGVTDGDGRFELELCEGQPGAPPGRYRVQLQLLAKDGSDDGVSADRWLREESFVVPEGGGTVDVAVSTEPPKQAAN